MTNRLRPDVFHKLHCPHRRNVYRTTSKPADGTKVDTCAACDAKPSGKHDLVYLLVNQRNMVFLLSSLSMNLKFYEVPIHVEKCPLPRMLLLFQNQTFGRSLLRV